MLKQSIIELYDEYTHSGLPRPHFSGKIGPIGGGNDSRSSFAASVGE